jgi:LacI family transcriptional regulator
MLDLKPKATVADVARLAGVSAATVSRALTTPEVVSEQTRERVLAAAARLGFSPNPAARALRRQKSMIVGAVIPTLGSAIYARLVNAFQDWMSAAGYLTIVLTSGFDNGGVPEKVRLLIDHGVEGVLLVGQIHDPEFVWFLQQRRVPAVTTYSIADELLIPSIGFDNQDAMLRALQHLAERGHRDVLLLCGPLAGNDRQVARRAAFIGAMRRQGQPIENRVVECEYSIEAGERAFRDNWLHARGFTAVLCCSDVLAFGVIAECQRLGVRVPDDVSVVGFDDLEFSARLNPPLTTIAVPSEEMGRRAAEAIVENLRQGREILSLTLEAPLIVRQSTGVARVTGKPAESKGKAPAASDKGSVRRKERQV